MVVYLHGFLSSPASAKAKRLGEYLRKHAIPSRLVVPQLPPDPACAIAVIENAIADEREA
ncbi:MAG: YqiA/YcfP family alpha/beta fold hydrolase, partial [Burkholderiales bacterium]